MRERDQILNESQDWLRLGAPEKETRKDLQCPYQEPRKVPLAEKAKAYQDNLVEGIRQLSPVS